MQENKQSVIERVVRLVEGNKIKTKSKSLCGEGVSATDKMTRSCRSAFSLDPTPQLGTGDAGSFGGNNPFLRGP